MKIVSATRFVIVELVRLIGVGKMNIVKEEERPTTDQKEGKEFYRENVFGWGKTTMMIKPGMQSACDDADNDIKLFLGWFHCV